VKIGATAASRQADPRTIPMPLVVNDDGLAERVTTARTSAEAWKLLSDVPASPETLARLSAAAVACCAASDAIGRGLVAFGTLPPDAAIPDGWVDRMVELYRTYLTEYWALDDLAYEGAKADGWTVASTEPLVDDPAGRIAQRARWVAEECPQAKPALWRDKIERLLTECVAAQDVIDTRMAGRTLVDAVVHHRFTHWQKLRGAAS